jgi:hypothetical protein
MQRPALALITDIFIKRRVEFMQNVKVFGAATVVISIHACLRYRYKLLPDRLCIVTRIVYYKKDQCFDYGTICC